MAGRGPGSRGAGTGCASCGRSAALALAGLGAQHVRPRQPPPLPPRQVIHSHWDNEKGGSKGGVGDPGVLLPWVLITPDFGLAGWLSFVRELSRLFSLLT